MSETKPSPSNPLEQFVLLAKSAKGAAAVELVKQALDAPGVYVFGELLDMPNIVEVRLMFFFLHTCVYSLFIVFCFDMGLSFRMTNNISHISTYCICLLMELTFSIFQ